MSNRRMFSNRIGNSAKFLQMPAEAQNFYFHLVLRADDDGIVEAYPISKILGIAPDIFKVLYAKKFIRQLNEDQVILINDWLEHNNIRADRKIDSIYSHLLPKGTERIEPKARSDVKDNSARLSGGQSKDGIGQVRLGKVKLSKDKIDHSEQSSQVEIYNKDIVEVLEAFKVVNPSYKKYYSNKTQRSSAERMINEHGKKVILATIDYLPKSNAQKYAPTITTAWQLEENLGKLKAWSDKLKNNKTHVIL